MNRHPDVLNSWKEIAAYLQRGVRTVQRWERELSLPIHRPRRQMRSAVMASRSELDGWLRMGFHVRVSPPPRIPENIALLRAQRKNTHEQWAQLRKNLQKTHKQVADRIIRAKKTVRTAQDRIRRAQAMTQATREILGKIRRSRRG